MQDIAVRNHGFGARSLSRQFAVLMTVCAALVLVLASAGSLGLMRTRDRAAHRDNLTNVVLLSSKLSSSIYEGQASVGAYMDKGKDTANLDLGIAKADRALAAIASLRALEKQSGLDYSEQTTIAQNEAVRFRAQIYKLYETPDDQIYATVLPLFDASHKAAAQAIEVRQQAEDRLRIEADAGNAEIEWLTKLLIGLGVTAMIVVIIGREFMRRRIVKPITNIAQVSDELAAGDSTLVIPEIDRQDEIGTMARALEALRRVQQAAADAAGAELEQQIAAQAERDRRVAMVQSLAGTFERLIGQVASDVAAASGQLKDAARTMSDNAEESAARVVNASRLLSESSQGVTGAAAASDEFVMSIGEISRQAALSAQRANEANGSARDADRTISDLDTMASNVSRVVEMIGQIAQRTNLLALNASIEAARGGEAGRGFAVVASEVKELAMQTARATEDVEAQIRQIQTGSGASAAALRRISHDVGELEMTATSIAAAVDQQAIAGQELARSIDVAARNASAVSADMDQVSRLTTATGAAASQVLDSCTQLEGQAGVLRTQVAEFLEHVRAA